ncbi:MAG TPA: hypothetical protein DDY49_06995 [Paenibacillaceae bacterium]|nr:hypothetical protein [Paenibacillaceae bacterium]
MSTRKSKVVVLLLGLLLLVTMTGCIPGDGTYTIKDPAGFFWGIWHGWIAPISLIVGIFDNNIRIYEPNNVGWLYDLGFYISIIGGFGSLSLFRKKKKED